MHAQQMAAHAAATGATMGPPGLPPGLGPSPHPGLTPSSLQPGITGASLAASGLLALPNPLAAQLSGFPAPMPPGLKDDRPSGSGRPASVEDRIAFRVGTSLICVAYNLIMIEMKVWGRTNPVMRRMQNISTVPHHLTS
ncbi:unnamed protein product [Soboliphyme baturini]|uniref:RAVR2 protein n=1 Tax=Soboliphyme baturini TaxID=241478 RepID=A0A183IKA7_9BILA|nr:unnamed protein product [Soboliphyme baturini]